MAPLDQSSKIYIAGHTGMVGSAIIRKFQVRGYNNLLTKTRQQLDLLNQGAVVEFFKKNQPDYVIVAAARVGGIKANQDNLPEFLFENAQIELNLIWNAHLAGVKKLLFLGSSCVYPREALQPIKEESLLSGPLEITNEGYAIAKIMGIKLCKYIFEKFGQVFISCMPTNLYGPGDNFDLDSAHVLPALLRKIDEAKRSGSPRVEIWGSGNPRREFLHVDDLADAVFWLMENYSESDLINVGTGQDLTIRELAELIKRQVGYAGELFFNVHKPDGTPRKLLDLSKLHKLGWHHQTDLMAGVALTYEWYLKNIAKIS